MTKPASPCGLETSLKSRSVQQPCSWAWHSCGGCCRTYTRACSANAIRSCSVTRPSLSLCHADCQQTIQTGQHRQSVQRQCCGSCMAWPVNCSMLCRQTRQKTCAAPAWLKCWCLTGKQTKQAGLVCCAIPLCILTRHDHQPCSACHPEKVGNVGCPAGSTCPRRAARLGG